MAWQLRNNALDLWRYPVALPPRLLAILFLDCIQSPHAKQKLQSPPESELYVSFVVMQLKQYEIIK
jgi:hypothetical protein